MQNKCVLPFINQDYQWNKPCCVLEDYDRQNDLQELLDDHRNNRQSRFCRRCYKNENIGIKSKRQFYNGLYSSYLDLEVRSLKTAVIPVGNKCNLYCVMCNPYASTSWFKKYNFMGDAHKWGKDDVIKEKIDIDFDSIEHIEFIGGETLRSDSLWTTLTELDKSVKFSLQTNGTVELNQKQIELLNSFENFNICFSIDGYEKIFEYIRQPAKWDQVSKNVNAYKKYFGLDKLSTYCTINNLNILHVDRIMIEIFKLLPSKIDLNMVYAPSEFAFDNLPPAVGEIVQNKNPVFFKKNKITWNGNTESKKALLDNLEKQDKFSKLSLEQYLPEVYDLLK